MLETYVAVEGTIRRSSLDPVKPVVMSHKDHFHTDLNLTFTLYCLPEDHHFLEPEGGL